MQLDDRDLTVEVLTRDVFLEERVRFVAPGMLPTDFPLKDNTGCGVVGPKPRRTLQKLGWDLPLHGGTIGPTKRGQHL
jgi:hypothetical protein